MTTQMLAAKTEKALREQWLQSLKELVGEVSGWAIQQKGWHVESEAAQSVSEEALGTYDVPVLTIHTPEGRLILEPIARNFPGSGIVELYAWPSLFRVRLLQDQPGDEWEVRIDSWYVVPQQWNRESFVQIAHSLLGTA